MSLQREADPGIPDAALPGKPRNRQWLMAIRVIVVIAALALFALQYYERSFPGFLDRGGCDIAQIARNISDGEGFSTHLVRPFNVSFVTVGQQDFPELNRAPLFPYALAAAYRKLGASDQITSMTSVAFFVGLLGATVLLGALLFNARAGLLGAAVVGLSMPMLQSAISGHEWPMAGLWFTLLLCAIAMYHKASVSRSRACICYAALAALPLALLYATHYAAVVLVVPIAVYFGITGRSRRMSCIAFVVLTFILISPLMYLNYCQTKNPVLGVSAWDVMANTRDYPGDSFYRSVRRELVSPSAALLFPVNHFPSFARKLVQGSSDLFCAVLPMLGLLGLPFAAVSSLYRFKAPQANAVRGVCYACAAVLLPAFALLGVPGESALLFCPVIAVTAAGYLILLMDAKQLHPIFVRFLLAGFGLITAAPAVSQMIWPATLDAQDDPRKHLPYVLAQMRAVDIPLYTDQPWTVAWRTTCKAVWLPAIDTDMSALDNAGFPIRVIIMTRECERYNDNDFWRALYTTPCWRTYTNDPNAAVADYLKSAQVPTNQLKEYTESFRQERRRFTISDESLAGFKAVTTDPLRPNDVQILQRGD